ncbi:hypothetical protein JI270_09610 [Escherichia coli]|nr:hypothetical protein [Escherichia coli]
MESNHLCIQRLPRLFSGLKILALAKGLTQLSMLTMLLVGDDDCNI